VWPSKVKFNGTYIIMAGCNSISIPIKIDYSTLRVQTSTNGQLTTKNACGNIDQPFIQLILSTVSLKAYGNQTAIQLVFYDANKA
jgi:heat shock protein HslJ